MILFSTILPVKEDISDADIMEAVISWENDKDFEKEYEDLEDKCIYHYTKDDGIGIPWSQTFIFDKNDHLLYITQETSCATDPEVFENTYSTPSIIANLIDQNILKGVSKDPVDNFNRDLELPKLIVNNKKNSSALAYRLKGAAQVIFDPLSKSKYIFMDKTVSKKDVIHKVLNYGRFNLYNPLYSWESISKILEYKKQNNTLSLKIDEINKKISEDNDLIASYEEEISSLEAKVSSVNNELSANALKISGLESKLKGNKPLLFYGNEEDLYEGEIKDFVLSLIEREIKNIPEKTRKRDVFQSLIESNEYTGTGESIVKQIKTAFKDYSSLAGSTKQILESLGFEVVVTKEHYKIYFKGDKRYLVILSKTSGDHREGRNFASAITTAMFL